MPALGAKLAVLLLALAAAQPSRPDDFALSGEIAQGGTATGTAPQGTVRLTLDGEPVDIAPDRHFLIAFDRDHGPSATLAAVLADGRMVSDPIAVAPRAWRIEHVDVARRPEGPTQEYLKLREGETKRIVAARAVHSDSDGWRQHFRWPARGRISGQFGAQRVYRGEPAAYHSGTDIAAGAGAEVVAPADGVVVLAGPPAFSLEGNLVIVDHGMGLNSAFLHLSSVAVHEGQRLKQGDPIGTVGMTGRATGPHLHWSMMWHGARIDAQQLVEAK